MRPYADIELGCIGLLFFGAGLAVPILMVLSMLWSGCKPVSIPLGDYDGLAKACANRPSLRCESTIQCGYNKCINSTYIYRGRMESDMIGWVHLSAAELSRVLDVLETK